MKRPFYEAPVREMAQVGANVDRTEAESLETTAARSDRSYSVTAPVEEELIQAATKSLISYGTNNSYPLRAISKTRELAVEVEVQLQGHEVA